MEDENDDISAISMAVDKFEKARAEAIVMASSSKEELVHDSKATRLKRSKGSVSFVEGDEFSDHQPDAVPMTLDARPDKVSDRLMRQHTGGTLEI